MDHVEHARVQSAAMAQVEALMQRMEAGELTPEEVDQRVETVMQGLQQQTVGYLAAQSATLARQQQLLKAYKYLGAIVVLALLAFVVSKVVS